MPIECCAYGCNYRTYKGNAKGSIKKSVEQRILHRIPKNKDRRREWLAAINRKNINPDTSRLCGKHFITGIQFSFLEVFKKLIKKFYKALCH